MGNKKCETINADSIRHEPLEILPDSEKDTLVAYLKEHVDNVEVVVMDMIHSFKAVLRKALNYLTIVADCFHFTSYTLLGV